MCTCVCMCVSMCVHALGHTSAWTCKDTGDPMELSLGIISFRLGEGSCASSDLPGIGTHSYLASVHSHLQCMSVCAFKYFTCS